VVSLDFLKFPRELFLDGLGFLDAEYIRSLPVEPLEKALAVYRPNAVNVPGANAYLLHPATDPDFLVLLPTTI